jgi:hypothetical protein
MTAKFEVIESRIWRNAAGRAASIYGAAPWLSEAQKIGEGWEIVSRGWTVQNPHTGQVGICRAPWATREEAESFAANNHPPRTGYGD